MQPEISFIVPTHNTAKYLDECLNSILAVPIAKEIIVIDDGSSDDTFEIAQRHFFKQSETIVLIRQGKKA